jgi:phosphoglycolate phosphatase
LVAPDPELKYRLAIFDFDGTLADTSADLIAAANAALAEAGAAAQLEARGDAALAFEGGRAMLRAGLARSGARWSEADVDRLYPELLARYEEGIAVHTRLYDGAEDALARLSAAGWALGICTNKPAALADRLLGLLGVRQRFAALLGADSLPVRKPDPRHLLETIARAGGVPSRAVLVGDNANDRAAAEAAAVPCVLVGFGPEGAGLARLAPQALFGHYRELPALLDGLVPDPAILA